MNNKEKVDRLAFLIAAFIIAYALLGCGPTPGGNPEPPPDTGSTGTVKRVMATNQNGHVYTLEPFDWEYNNGKDIDEWR